MKVNSTLLSLADAEALVKGNEAFYKSSTVIEGHVLDIFNYRLAKESDFFKPLPDSNMDAFEMRGLMFVTSPGGSIKRYLRLPKFFNLNQCESTQYDKVKDKKIVSVTKKMDGSMLSFIKINDKVFACTKMGPSTDVALAAQKLYEKQSDDFKEYISDAIDMGQSVIFEFLDRDMPIVILHKESKFIPLWIRDIDGSITCANDVPGCPRDLEVSTEIPMVTNGEYLVVDDVLAKVKEMDAAEIQEEGFVVMFEDGHTIKVKTEWYMTWHNFKTEGIFSVDLAIAKIINEKSDDWLACLELDDPRRATINDMTDKLRFISLQFETLYLSIKEFIRDSNYSELTNEEARKKLRERKGLITSDIGVKIGPKNEILKSMITPCFTFAVKTLLGRQSYHGVMLEQYNKFVDTLILKNTYRLQKARKFLEEVESIR